MTEQQLKDVKRARTAQPQQKQPETAQGADNIVSEQGRIRSDYACLGVRSGYTPPDADRLRMFLIGPPGGGKTTFVASMPRTLILDYEDGAWGVPRSRAHRIVVREPQQQQKILDKLVADSRSPNRPYDRVVFDTVDQWVELNNTDLAEQYSNNSRTIRDITQDYGTKGAGYNLLRKYSWSQLERLEKAGYSWVCVGHMSEKTLSINDKDVTVLRPVLYSSFAQVLVRNCELFGGIHAENETEPVYKEVRGKTIKAGEQSVIRVYLDVQSSGCQLSRQESKTRGVPTMSRKIHLPDPMKPDAPLGWDEFVRHYKEAIAEVQQQSSLPSNAD